MENRLTRAEGGRPALGRRPGRGRRRVAPAPPARRLEGVRGDVRPAGQPAVPRRPDQPGPAAAERRRQPDSSRLERPRLRSASLAEGRHDVHDGGAEQHDEQRRQDAEDQREDHLHRDLHRLLLGALTALEPHLLRLGAQHVGDRDAVRVGLDDGADEARAGPARRCGRPAPGRPRGAAGRRRCPAGSAPAPRPAGPCRSRRPGPSPTRSPSPASTAMVIWSRVSAQLQPDRLPAAPGRGCAAAARAGSRRRR